MCGNTLTARQAVFHVLLSVRWGHAVDSGQRYIWSGAGLERGVSRLVHGGVDKDGDGLIMADSVHRVGTLGLPLATALKHGRCNVFVKAVGSCSVRHYNDLQDEGKCHILEP